MNIIIWILQYLHFSSVLSMIHSDHLTILTMDIIFYRFTLTPFFFSIPTEFYMPTMQCLLFSKSFFLEEAKMELS